VLSADHSSRGVLPTVVRRCVWSRNLKNEEAMTRVGSQRHSQKKKKILCEIVLTYHLYEIVHTCNINLEQLSKVKKCLSLILERRVSQRNLLTFSCIFPDKARCEGLPFSNRNGTSVSRSRLHWFSISTGHWQITYYL
jgi:hypothetical protein